MKRYVPARKAPLALAGFFAIPLFFAALMAVSLAIEKPRVVEWSRPGGRLARIYHDPAGSLELKIWLLAVVPPLLLVAAGYLASFLRRGVYISCACAIVGGLALTARLATWERHHTSRFPNGEDLYPDNSTSSLVNRGQWEHDAAQTVHSLVDYAIALAVAAAAIALFLEVRRRRGPVATGPSELQQTGGAPTTSGA